MDIVVAAAEVAPWSKTGGLGDVCGALPGALAARGHRVMTVSPRYKEYPDAWDTGARARIYLYGAAHEVRFFHCLRAGVHHVFVDHPCFHRSGIYGDSRGAYGDNLFRFALLSRAVFEAATLLPLGGAHGGAGGAGDTAGGPGMGERVVFHANDWHTGLVPVYLHATWKSAGRFRGSASTLGLHNLGHQGNQPAHEFAGLDLSTRWWGSLEYHGQMNLLKAGIVTADKLIAVSPTYARQIRTDHGFGLEPLLEWRQQDLHGVLNGIGPEWDPATDPHLPAAFSADDLSGKAACKAAVQRELGLPARADPPLLALIARLDAQKGIDLVQEILPGLMRQDVQVALLGSGAAKYQDFFRDARARWPSKVGAHIGFSEALAHRIEAGADIFLMPSRFEPCGLNQMYSLRYGALPVVHATGGLADTVHNFDPWRDRGNGWAFRTFSAEAFAEAVGWAVGTYRDHPDTFRRLQARAMREDHSWDRAAALYERVFAAALERQPG